MTLALSFACCFRAWSPGFTEERAQKSYDTFLKLETEFGEYFTGRCPPPPLSASCHTVLITVAPAGNRRYLLYVAAQITGNTAEEIYAKVKEVIVDQSGSTIWIPSKDPL